AARLLRPQAEVLHDEAELLARAEGGGDPEHRERALARAPAVEDLAVARQQDEAFGLGPARQDFTAARRGGDRSVARGPQPAREPAQAGVAQEPWRRAVLVAVPGRRDQRAGAGRDQPPVHAVAGEGVDAEEATGERHAFALAPLLPPAHQECYPEVQPPRPHEGQQVAEPSLEAVLDPPRHPATFTPGSLPPRGQGSR